MTILKAELQHLNDLVPLFDGYRKFYKQTSDLKSARQFLTDRITNQESIIYIAYIDKSPVGFTQLYPLYSSVSMETMYLLNDLFVDGSIRSQGVGQELIQAAKDLCVAKNYKGLALQTEFDNRAQHLYERVGFVKDTDLHFFWTNTQR